MLNSSIKRQKIYTKKTAESQLDYLRAGTSDAEDGDCGSRQNGKT